MGRVNTVTIVSGGSNYNAGETITVPGGNEDCVLGIVSVSNVENNNFSTRRKILQVRHDGVHIPFIFKFAGVR